MPCLYKICKIMLRNYLKIALRNLLRNKVYSFINIGGLAVGMAVAMLIGLWVWDELSFNKQYQNHDDIAQVMQHQSFNGEIRTQTANPVLMGQEIRDKYGSDFKYVLQSSWNNPHILSIGEKRITKKGTFFEPQVTEMLSLTMLQGTRAGLKDPYSILLSESVAKAYFGNANPLGKIIKLDNKYDLKITGVYEDLPNNSSFNNVEFLLSWSLYLSSNPWIKEEPDPWKGNFTQTFVQIAQNTEMEKISDKIKKVKFNRESPEGKKHKAEVFLQPMSKWHLYSDFKNGINTGGRIEFVWLFGIIGLFVLLLACINFMNLATARSEKRAKEVGVRKAIGSKRGQLISQFFAESLLVVVFSLILSLILVELALPLFNEIADKRMSVLWQNPIFWFFIISFSLLTSLIAGSYPALYLSSFQPIKVLKGTFSVGKFASIPRKVLVVMQFTVSITLIIGTIIVFQQIEHAKNRAVGYNREGLITLSLTDDIFKHLESFRNELKSKGIIEEMAISQSPLTDVWSTNTKFDWEGKDPNLSVDFPNNSVTHAYGKTVGWEIKEGRDFSKYFATDSSAFIINETAAKFIGLKNPVGKTLKWEGEPYTIIGVVKDLLVQSPYEPSRPSLYHITNNPTNLVIIRMKSSINLKDELPKMEVIVKKYNPSFPFEYEFVDEIFARKFGDEERIGKLSAIFAILAIFISCLGLFGLASFVAEQRTKEIGIRKVLGASVANLWQLLSKDFVVLVIISCLIATPIAYYFMNEWLQKYNYRTGISWWIFVVAGAGSLLITLLTVSYQAIRAALMNPVKSLRTE